MIQEYKNFVMKKYNFPIVVTQDEDGIYMASVPTLPGCHTQAKTMKLLQKRIQEAIELYLEVELEDKKPIMVSKFIGIQQVEVTI
ncbi:MAG: type II toxin-antitoxin system HicB family antitoxin [Patescibacteria group bacterium]